MTPPKLLRTVAFSILTFLFAVAMGVNTSFAQNTIYVDATNGSNLNAGTSANPVATIEKGLDLLENTGTLVVKGSTYSGTNGASNAAYTIQASSNSANDLESFTLRLEPGVANVIDLESTALTVNLAGTLTVTSSSGAYLNQQNAGLTLQDGDVNIDASSSWRLANGTNLTLTNDAAFTGAAPQKGTNLNLTYNGGTVTTKTAGPEASYGNYGSGNITVNLTNASADLTLPASITTTGNFTKTDGAVTLNGNLSATNFTNTADSFEATGSLTTTGTNTHTAGNVTVGSLTVSNDYAVTANNLTVNGSVSLSANGADLINNGTGAVNVTGNVSGRIITGGTADANISSIENAGTGSTTVSGTVTITADNNFAGGSFAGTPVLYANDGNLSTGNFIITTSAPSAGNDVGINVVFTNDDDGSLTVGNVTATEVAVSGPNSHIYNVDINNSSTGSVTVGTGRFEDLANTSTGSVTVGSATFTANVTNDAGGTVTLAGGTVTGNLSNNNAASTMDVNGDLTVSGTLTNAGTGTGNGIDIDANTVTLSGANAHATNGGVIRGSGKVLVTATSSFNGGTLPNVEVDGSGITVTLQTNAVTADAVEVADGTLAVNIATTIDSINMSGGNATVGAVVLTTDDYTQSTGTVTLNNGATLDVNDSFTRTAGTFTANATSTLSFTGTAAQSVNVGDNFQANNVTFNNTAGTITLNRSIRSNGNATIAASTTVDFQGFNLIMNGGTSDFTLTGSYENTTNGGVYFGGVDAAGTIVVQGGSAAAGQTFSGTGTFGNIFVAVGAANTLTFDDATSNAGFTNNLTLVSGTLDINDGGAATADLSPSGTEAQVVVYPEGSGGITTTNGTFNGDNVDYDLLYEGSISANKTISNEFTANVVDVTISTTTNSMVFADQDYTVKGDLTVESGATLQANAAGADRTVTVKGTLTVAGDITDVGSANTTTFVLETDNESHSVTGTFTDAGTSLDLEIQGDGITVSGSGTSTAGKNIIDADILVTGNSATISGLQDLDQNVTLDAATATGLSLSLIDPDQAGAATVGLISGNLTVDGASAGAATLTLGSNVEVTGTTNVGATGTIAFGGNDLDINGAFTGNAAATYTSSGGHLDVVAVANVDANGADIPYVRTSAATTLISALEVSGHLDLDANLVGAVALELSGNADLNADITNNVSFTGSSSAINVNAAARTITGTVTVNSTGTVTFGNDGTGRTLNVTGNYTHTAGAVELGANTLDLQEDLVYTAGSITSSTSGTVEVGSGNDGDIINTNNNTLTLVNLDVADAVTIGANSGSDTDKVKVTNKVLFEDNANATITIDQTGDATDFIVGDGATIDRRNNAANFSLAPTFEGQVNLAYLDAAAIATGVEVPSTDIIDDVSVTMTGVDLDLSTDITVNGTLSINSTGRLDEQTNDVTMASGSTIVMNGGSIGSSGTSDGNVTATDYNVIYRVTQNTSGELVGTQAAVTVDNQASTTITVTSTSAQTFASLTTGAGDVLQLNGNSLTLTGDVSVNSSSAFANSGANTTITLSGSSAQTFTVPSGGLTLPGDGNNDVSTNDGTNVINVTIDNSAGVTLAGGDLVMGENSTFTFTDGVVQTGTNAIELWHRASNGSYSADQGFSRTDGHVFGQVRKTLPSSSTSIPAARVEYPVGGNNLDASNSTAEVEYSPVAFTFNNPSSIAAGIKVTVDHNETNPGGTNALPITDGIESGVDLTRYPDEFHWVIKSSSSLSPTVSYDIEMERQGYSEYTQDGSQADVEDLRIIRRAAGNTDNDWSVQADGASSYSQNYQTGTFPNVYPTIIAQSVEGSIIGGNGSVFTYGLKSNLEVQKPADLTANVGQTRTIALVADSVFSGGTGDYTYTLSGNDAAVATGSVANDTLTISAVGEGTTTFTIDVEDELGDTNQTSVTITVNPALTVGTIEDAARNVGDSVMVDLDTVFTPGTGDITYTATTSDAAVATVSITDPMLKVNAVAAGSATITVTGTDETGASESTSFTMTVNGAFAATGNIADQELRDGDGNLQDADSFSFDDVATLFDGGTAPFTYSVSETSSEALIAAAIDENNDLSVTVNSSTETNSTSTVTITAEDSFGATASVEFDVTTLPAIGDVNYSGSINTTDAQNTLEFSLDLRSFNAVQEAVADVNNNGDVNSFDASVMFRYWADNGAGNILIPFSPSAKVPTGDLAYGEAKVEDGKAIVPVNISGNGINSVDFIAEYSTSGVSLESLELTGLPEDWVVVTSTEEEGMAKFAIAGITPISDAQIATLTFKLSGSDSDISLRATGFVNDSEYATDELSVKELPQSFALEQNYPNPFNPTTNVRYQLPASADVTIELFTINGQKVQTLVSKRQDAGTHTLTVDGANLSSGVYVYRITAKSADASFTSTRKMTLIK